MNHNQIKSTVYNLIKKYETRNPVRLAKELDIIIQIGDLKKISGCYLKIHERDFIYINEKLLDNEKKYYEVLAHELGHAVLHKEDFYFFSFGKNCYENSIEQEAQTFASELLIPDEVILDHKDYTKEQLAMLTGYTPQLIAFKQL